MNDIIAEDSDLIEASEVPALTEMDSKTQIISHLFHVHFNSQDFYCFREIVHAHDTKATKAQLLALHATIHEVLDHPDRVDEGDTAFVRDQDTDGYQRTMRAQVPAAEHVHILDQETSERLDAARANKPVADKPLSAAERKILQELVDNDFNSLKSQMRAFAADTLAATKAEINAEWDDKVRAASKLVERATVTKRRHKEALDLLRDKQRVEWDRLIEEAKERGYVLNAKERTNLESNGATTKETYYEAEAVGRKEALDKADAENKLSIDRALMTLERQRLDAQRQVLVSGVSKEAATILDTIPSAQTMMIEAGLTDQPKAIG